MNQCWHKTDMTTKQKHNFNYGNSRQKTKDQNIISDRHIEFMITIPKELLGFFVCEVTGLGKQYLKVVSFCTLL